MKAVQFARHGNPPDVVELVDLETGSPADDEVVIRVEAAPINPADLLRITGAYGAPTPLPAILGAEGVGRVVEVGAGVTGLGPGDRVTLPLGRGTWREEMLAKAGAILPLPADGDALQLAMVTINPPTAYLMLHEYVSVTAGEWVIQNAANSGVGRYLIELAALDGIKTVNVVRREDVIGPLEALGAEVVVVDGPDLAARVRAATGEAEIGLGIDAVGGEATERLAGCLAEGGTVVNYGLLSGEACRVPAMLTVFKDIRLCGFWLVRWYRDSSPEARRALGERLLGLVMDGTLRAEVDSIYPLERVKEALSHAMAAGRSGKILLVPGETA